MTRIVDVKGYGIIDLGADYQADELDVAVARELDKRNKLVTPIPQIETKNSLLQKTGELLTNSKTVEIGLPMAGAVIGGGIGGPIGMAIGAGAGRGIFDVAKNLMTDEDIPVLDQKTESIVGNMLGEGAFTLLGDKVLRTVGGLPVVKKFLKASTDAVKNATGETIGRAVNTLGNLIQETLGNVPEKVRDTYISTLANQFKIKNGIPELATKRAAEKGFKNILSPEKIDITKIGMSQGTIDKVATVTDKAFDATRKKFEEAIQPIFKVDKTPVNIDEPIKSYAKSLADIITIKKISPEKVIYEARAPIDNEIARTFQSFSEDIEKLVKNPSSEKVHQFKQYINKILEKPKIDQNKSAKSILFKLKAEIVNVLEKKVPGYKEVMNEYQGLFDIEDVIGGKFTKEHVEPFLTEYFNPGKQSLRTFVDNFISKTPEAKAIMDEALNERTSLFFRDLYAPGEGPRLGFQVFGMGARAGLEFLQETPQKVAKQLIRKESSQTLRPITGLITEAIAASTTGQNIQAPIKRLIRTKEGK